MFDEIITFIKKRYTSIPTSLLNVAGFFYYLIPAKKRYGIVFNETWEMLEKTEKLTENEKDILIDELFINTLRNAIQNVPYYKEIAEERGLAIDQFSSIKDIDLLPFLDKEIINNQGRKMISETADENRIIIKHTSGSTGKPLALYFDKSTEMREWANVLHLWKRVGFNWDSSRVVLRGAVFKNQKKGKNYQWDALRRDLSLNIHDMSEDNCKLYCRLIEKYKPEFIYGYPSAIFQLCHYIDEHEKLQHHFKAALTMSETVTDSMREYIEKILETRVYSFYGHTERAAIAGECESNTHYHIEPTYGYIELIDENDDAIEDERPGEIVVTGFTNDVMPLIRYRTGDIGQWDLSDCNDGYYRKKLKRVQGRTADFFFDKDKTSQNVSAYRYNSFWKYKVLQFQFIQNEYGIVELNCVCENDYSEEDEKGLEELLMEDSFGKIKFNINKVKQIKSGENGKTRLVIQKLK